MGAEGEEPQAAGVPRLQSCALSSSTEPSACQMGGAANRLAEHETKNKEDGEKATVLETGSCWCLEQSFG